MSRESELKRYKELVIELQGMEDLQRDVGVLSSADRLRLANLKNKVARLAPKYAPKKKIKKEKPKKEKVMEDDKLKEEVVVKEEVKCVEGECVDKERCTDESKCVKEGETVVEQLSEKE